MTIRFTCAECASVLKIKDELAGTSARCPKCKTKFVVPEPINEENLAAENTAADQSVPSTLDPAKRVADELDTQQASNSPLELFQQGSIGEQGSFRGIDEPLRLEDSDVGTQSTGPARRHDNEVPIPIQSSHAHQPAILDSNEDLDSLSVLIPAAWASRPVIESKPAKSFGRDSSSTENSGKNLPSKSVEAFDPLRFLMDDHQPPSHSSFSPESPNSRENNSLMLDSDDDFMVDPPTPTPLSRPTPLNRPTPTVSNSRLTPEKVDLATAAKMMKKAIKESQNEAAHQRELDAKAGFDFGQIFREFGLRGLGIVAGTFVIYFVLNYVSQGIFGPDAIKLPKLGYVTGTVTLDAKPLAGATVSFASIEPEMKDAKKERIRTSIGVTDANGFFRMKYYEKIDGVAAGKCRVWVSHMTEKGSDVPSDWIEQAMNIREIVAGHQKESIDIKMETKKIVPRK